MTSHIVLSWSTSDTAQLIRAICDHHVANAGTLSSDEAVAPKMNFRCLTPDMSNEWSFW